MFLIGTCPNLTMKLISLAAGVLILVLLGNSGLAQTIETAKPVRPHPPSPALKGKRSSRDVVKPGIYEAAPFAGIVIVPGPQFDDRAVLEPKGRGISMPTITPELRLIPRSPKGEG